MAASEELYVIPLEGGESRAYPNFTFEINRQRITLRPIKFLGRGNYGIVVQYNTKNNQRFAVKVESNIKKSDKDIITQLDSYDCGQISARVLGISQYGKKTKRRDKWKEYWKEYDAVFSLLEYMDGHFGQNFVLNSAAQQICMQGWYEPYSPTSFDCVIELFRRQHNLQSSIDAIVAMTEEVRKQMVCLFEESNGDYVYADLKEEQVLVNVSPDGNVTIKLGDLGSLMPRPGGNYTLTFPCKTGRGWPNKNWNQTLKKQCMAYELGLLLASLLGISMDNTHILEQLESKLPAKYDYLAHLLYTAAKRRDITKPLTTE